MFAARSEALRVNLHARARGVILFSRRFHVKQLVLVQYWNKVCR